MARGFKTDGQKFEEELERFFAEMGWSFIRLQTPQMRRSGSRNPADFVLFHPQGTLVLETKRTKHQSYNLSQLRQMWAFESFKGTPDAEMALLIHFTQTNEFVLVARRRITRLQAHHRAIRPNQRQTYTEKQSTLYDVINTGLFWCKHDMGEDWKE